MRFGFLPILIFEPDADLSGFQNSEEDAPNHHSVLSLLFLSLAVVAVIALHDSSPLFILHTSTYCTTLLGWYFLKVTGRQRAPASDARE